MKLLASYLFCFSFVVTGWIGYAADSAPVIQGKDGWMFLGAELRYLNAGPFWGEDAAKTSQATAPDSRDPEAAIVAFANSLKERGILLVFVPVPPKAVVMADKLPEGAVPENPGANQEVFYARLREQGVNVVDLTASFIEASKEPSAKIYCQQDAHWAPEGIALAAEKIAQVIGETKALEAPAGPNDYLVEKARITLTGDLWTMLGDTSLPKEELEIAVVKKGGQIPVSDEKSPVLLLGDSHTLFLSTGGDMQASGAGLAEHLTKEVRMPIEVIGVKGSGAGPSRVSFARKAFGTSGWLAGKKVVVYCLAAREFTEASGIAWKPIPIKTKP